MSKHLFVGGPADGKWFETQDRPWWEVAGPMSSTADQLMITQYISHVLACGPNRRTIYVVGGMSVIDAFDRLLKGYKPENTNGGK